VPELLIEIGCEELPAAACEEAERHLEGLTVLLAERFKLVSNVTVHVAPRRLVVIIHDFSPQAVPVRGPRADAPPQAREGFARRHGLDPASLEERDGFLWAVSEPDAGEVAARVMDGLVDDLRFSKAMRWEGGRFSRPVRWLVAKLEDEVLPLQAFGLTAGGRSRGHRFQGGEVEIGSGSTYLDDVRSVRVMADAGERRSQILAGLAEAGCGDPPASLVEEVVYLVEWPQVWQGTFDKRFLELPDRVVETAMMSHQRYFPVRQSGRLLPRFVFVANGGQEDVVVRGNQEVLVGRLADAEFAFATDLERGMEAMAGELGRVSFLEGSGSLADKTARVRGLADALGQRLGVDAETRAVAVRAAELAKADLVSNLVGEFSALEGFAGSVYAARAGESEGVAAAVAEHHLPYGFGGAMPSTPAGAIVSVADKADTLATAFRLGLEPTGSRDPFGLRRAAAGLVAVVLERGWDVGIEELVGEAAVPFVLDRVEALLTEQGVTVEEVRAARGAGQTEPVAVARLARGLHDAEGPGRDAIRDAYGRCRRIAGDADPAAIDAAMLADPAERTLAGALERAEGRMDAAIGDVPAMLAAAEELVGPVNAFFEEVLVMAEDEAVRRNRLALAARVAACLRRLGDFDQLPG
jgi:glycyl-tRNA synthetase beta chain